MAGIGPEIPAHLQNTRSRTPEKEQEEGPSPSSSVGPDVPKHLLQGNRSTTPFEEPDDSASTAPSIGPVVPPEVLARPIVVAPASEPVGEEEEEDDYTPMLPPELLAARAVPSKAPSASTSASSRRPVGPSFPSKYSGYDEDSDDEVGPMPLPMGVVLQEKDGVQEFLEKEERRRKQIEVSFTSSCLATVLLEC